MTIINVWWRTDIVNYFTPWLLKRLEEWFCYSRNPLFPSNPFTQEDKNQLAKWIWEISKKYNIYIQTCWTFDSYEEYWVHKSWCTTKEVLEQANNVTYKNIKASGMRKGCRCIPSHDIWAYDTCLNWCRYCYATKHHDKVKDIIKQHNPESPLLIWCLKAWDKLADLKQDSFILQDWSVKQLSLL